MSNPAVVPPTPKLNEMPEWDLSDLYPGQDSAELTADLDRALADSNAFAAAYQGKVAGLSGAEFGAAIAAFEGIGEILGRLMSYAQLVHAGNVSDPERGRFFQGVHEKVTDISTRTLFFTLEINRLEAAALEAKLSDPTAARYRPWLRDVRAFREHELSDDLEKLLREKEVTGRAAWVRLFDQTLAGFRFAVDGVNLTLTETLHRLSDPIRAKRQAAGQAIGRVLGENQPLLGLITNVLAKDKSIEDDWRRYPHSLAARNLSNHVEDEVVEALVSAVSSSYADLAHRYYALKAKWLKLDRLEYWDRNAPLPGDDDRTYSWPEAVEIVQGAYRAFSPELAAVGQRFFDHAWIDVPARPGKASGAFAHPTVPSAHPYLLLNFLGKARDVATLAHELGHGVHQVLAAGQGPLMADTPLTLAETASVFGEMLTFQALLKAESNPNRRRILLAGKVEDMLNTVVRQIAFHQFEKAVHAERRAGELSAERLGDIWMDVQTRSLGPSLHFSEEYRSFWAYIPHFVHSPFYVYAYAFGDCLVNSLYGVYESGAEGFEAKYLDLLRAGGTLRHKELLAPFGLNAADPAFWKKGVDVLSGFITRLEEFQQID